VDRVGKYGLYGAGIGLLVGLIFERRVILVGTFGMGFGAGLAFNES
jgi:dolichol kinase